MYITLEDGGVRPPTDAEALQIRTILGIAGAEDLALLTTRYVYADTDSPITLGVEGGIIFVDATAGAVSINLPEITAEMQTFVIKRVDSTSNAVGVFPAAADVGAQIEGEASYVVTALGGDTLRSNAGNWWLSGSGGGGGSVVTPDPFVTYTAADSPVALAEANGIVYLDATAGPIVLNLPLISGVEAQKVRFKRADSTNNAITIQPNAGDAGVTIEGESAFSLSGVNSADVEGNTVNWFTTMLSVADPISYIP